MKTIEENFTDWEAHVFGRGYGTGEPHTLGALKAFLAAFGNNGSETSYDYRKLELAVTPTVAWLLINTLCHANILEYGTSPRFGWLTQAGQLLKLFVDERTVDDLVSLTERTEDYHHCSPHSCNCGDEHEDGRACPNPFWSR